MKKRAPVTRLLWFLNLLSAILLIVTWMLFFIPLNWAGSLSALSFFVPVLYIIHTIFILFWSVKKKRKAWLSIACLLTSFLVFGPFLKFSSAKDTAVYNDAFEVMTYNVRNLNKNEQMPMAHVDSAIIKFIKKENPDILCVQESHYAMKRTTPLDDVFPHKFVDFIYGEYEGRVINSLYSKFPIIDAEVIKFPKSSNAALAVDILKNKDTIRIYNVHLQSFSVIPDVEHLKNEESSRQLKRIVQRLKKQEQQVEVLLNHISGTNHPILMTGDFNNVQFSKVYRKLKGDYYDTFLESGSGFGRTFKFFGLPVRIDYIFADNSFEVIAHTNYNVELSDHFPVMATLRLKP